MIDIHIQDRKVEVDDHINDENKQLYTTTAFIVSSSLTNPKYDMCISATINGGQKPHIVIVERKASRRHSSRDPSLQEYSML